MQLSRQIDLRSVGFSTGQAAVEVDCQNCEGVLFIGVPATTAAGLWSMALKAGATTTGFVNCAAANTHASTASNTNVLITDVHKPAKRWLGATLSSSSARPSFLLAFKYGLRKARGAMSSTANVPVATGGILRVVSPSSV